LFKNKKILIFRQKLSIIDAVYLKTAILLLIPIFKKNSLNYLKKKFLIPIRILKQNSLNYFFVMHLFLVPTFRDQHS